MFPRFPERFPILDCKDRDFSQLWFETCIFSVCACGKWVCTSEMCQQGYRDVNTGEEEEGEDEEEEEEENPEDDPHVKDIRWF